MKRVGFILLGLLFLYACSTADQIETDKLGETKDDTGETTYGFIQEKNTDVQGNWLLPHSYQVTVDDSFERLSKYETESSEEKMFFWHKPSADNFQFTLDTTSEQLEKEVPTIEIKPLNKNRYVYTKEHFSLGEELTEAEFQEIIESVTQEVEGNAEAHMEELKEKTVERIKRIKEMEGMEGEPTVHTLDDYDLGPYTYMIESEPQPGVIHYELIGELEHTYLRTVISVPKQKKDELFETMLTSVRKITYSKEDFREEAVLDEPKNLSYGPRENLQGSYPEVGYSFELPEAATFRYSFPAYHVYRYTFDTIYEESIEREHFTLRSSELVIQVEQEENARNREEELRNKSLNDFVAFQYDQARSITYLHEKEDFDTGIFTTAVRVDFDGYEEYWFLKEIDGHVYEVTFDIAIDAPEYDKLLKNYLNVVRTFELKGV
ncbi:hypothetical protein SAMN05192534_1543 [Alteribacillus persepolensis]|uniref:DUF4367 domain-containing protein n=1 Tax=Alteribacillus persepolensis TaxID=568899 RepID=A0A1G8KKK3_9BACI|nr:hypothetical protein [Alteribacillus persepolensis]SDI43967.1 hypothetical protein SAMN05192534_1543 [Alteribacillus persepolensis]